MGHVCSEINRELYQNHSVFKLIEHMKDYYDGVSDTCFHFIPEGTSRVTNYALYVYLSLHYTPNSIRMLLKVRHITDAFVLIRKLFDTVLVEIYFDMVRKDKFDWMECFVVNDVDEWLKGKHRIPRTEKILNVLKKITIHQKLVSFFWLGNLFKKEP